MATKAQVLELFDKNPTWTSYQIAAALGPDVMPEYVRTTLRRNGRRLHRFQAKWRKPTVYTGAANSSATKRQQGT